jgi:hypothetical protein
VGGTLGDLALGAVATVAHTAAKAASHGVDWEQLLTAAAIWAGIIGGIAAVVAIVPMSRNGVLWTWRALRLRAGAPHRHYATWFARRRGRYDNPYLNATENLDLRNTFVPLSFRSSDDDDQEQMTLTVATTVLDDPAEGNLIIYGGPGSGKSTLLKSYGVGTLLDQARLGRPFHTVPFFVPLRHWLIPGGGPGL